ncbi:MAG: transcription-repair coupling factor [Phycisphaerales bacterium]
MDPLTHLAADERLAALARALGEGRRVVATGAVGSSTSLVAGALAGTLGRPVVLVVAHADEGDEIADELNDAQEGLAVALPALEALPGSDGTGAEQFAQRARVVRRLREVEASEGVVIVCPIASLMQLVPAPDKLIELIRSIRVGDPIGPTELVEWLVACGYKRLDAIEEPGDLALRGGILDVFPPAGVNGLTAPVRLDFFGDEVESIREIDPDTMGSDRAIDRVDLVAVDPARLAPSDSGMSALDLIPREAVVILSETQEVVEQGRGYYERVTDARGIEGPPAVLKRLGERFGAMAEVNQFSASAAAADTRLELPVEPLPAFERDASAAVGELGEMTANARVVVTCLNEGERTRLSELLSEHAPGAVKAIELVVRYVHRGFIWGEGDERVAVVPSHELLHRYDTRRRASRLRAGRAMDTFLDIAPGDYVVHADHGIAKFVGLQVMRPGATRSSSKPSPDAQEFLTLEFAGGSKLHVPCARIDLVQKYVGGFKGKPPLSHMGGAKWKNQKAKVAESVRDLAGELLRVRAAREHMPGVQYPADTPWQKEFEAEFPYQETEDQLAALAEIKKDMTSPRPMDRLLCGDVGFGKTELAIRAAFKACEFGRQVAVLVPTTVLAEQHERTFRQRFADYPFKVESLSRFKTTREINQTLKAVRKGEIDVVIGTHRLLSKDVHFADLGLVVIDEEQRFGVEHKERLLQLRMTVDVLTLSATPIPRTLHMAMLGLRDISSLTTPPLDRRAIVTEVIPYNEKRIQQAIKRELAREGQIFFVHNRVYNIKTVADEVQKLAPGARVVFGHGQMPPKELEDVMLQFMRRQADILVSTTIIESGIDIPTANTMIINDADRFGLADLHQLRGRVGRYKHRAYCYMLLPIDRPLKEVAQKRLKAIEQYSMLGAGFKIAMRDLEIRGAGNLLGAEQSGHIAAVGYEMYCRLLDRAVHELTESPEADRVEHCAVEIGISGIIPKVYIPSDQRRLEAYRRLAAAGSPEEIDRVEEDLASAYGQAPAPVRQLAELARVRAAAASLGVRAIARHGPDIVFALTDPQALSGVLAGAPGSVRVIPPELAQTNARSERGAPLAEVYWRPPPSYLEPDSLARVLARRLSGQTEPGVRASAGRV